MESRVQALVLDKEVEVKNNRIYPKEVMVRAVEEFDQRLKKNDGVVIGECQPPPDDLTLFMNMHHVSHVVKHAHIEAGSVVAIIDTVGKFDTLDKKGIAFGGTLRTLDFNKEGKEMVGARKKGEGEVVFKSVIVTVDLQYREVF